MTKQEAITKYYKLRNEAYENIEKLNHPDFMYWEETAEWKLKLQLYEEFLNILIKLQ